jgi:hypothetical protein
MSTWPGRAARAGGGCCRTSPRSFPVCSSASSRRTARRNAFIARVPIDVFAFYRQSSALRFLANEPYDTGRVAEDFDAKLRQLDVGFVLVHPSMLDRDRADAILVMLRGRSDLEAVSTGTDTVAFRVRDRTSAVPAAASPAGKNLPL